MAADGNDKQHACLAAIVEKQSHGWYAFCPALTGVRATGRSYDEVLGAVRKNARDILTGLASKGQPVPRDAQFMMTVVEVEW